MRRKKGALVPLEQNIINAAVSLRSQGRTEFYGYELARHLQTCDRKLTTNGTIYRALQRLEHRGLLQSRLEADQDLEGTYRPGRRMYQLISTEIDY